MCANVKLKLFRSRVNNLYPMAEETVKLNQVGHYFKFWSVSVKLYLNSLKRSDEIV